MSDRYTIDLHCHATLKPYSKSFRVSENGGQHSKDPEKKHSIWFQKRPRLINRASNLILSITKFTQSDFRSSREGGVRLQMVSIDPMEKNLVLSRKGNPSNFLGKLLKNFVMGIGWARINYIAKKIGDDYYADLIKTREYLLSLNDTPIQHEGKELLYEVLSGFPSTQLSEQKLYVIFTIEGGHVFNTNTPQVLDKVKALKQWTHRPVWVSLAHHFSNGLCGHAKSFKGLPTLAYNQKLNPEQGLTPLGLQVIDELLTQEGNQKRVLIDAKHMNLKSRWAYYAIAETKQVPILVSHGALMFLKVPKKPGTPLVDASNEINFYNDELVRIAKSGGLFGFQLDQRRIKQVKQLKVGSKPIKFKMDRTFRKEWKQKTGKKFRRRWYRRAYYIFKQVSYFAELLDSDPNFDGKIWNYQSIGSDFDGIVDPINGFWTHRDYPVFIHYFQLNVQRYIEKGNWKNLRPANRLNARGIVDKFAHKNAEAFLRTNYA
ncbi:MAG: membrane dipeptidase [Flavobacteriaceae bacterium]|nr:membrane dipeptidase [Flavobacteriaceae bacterium]